MKIVINNIILLFACISYAAFIVFKVTNFESFQVLIKEFALFFSLTLPVILYLSYTIFDLRKKIFEKRLTYLCWFYILFSIPVFPALLWFPVMYVQSFVRNIISLDGFIVIVLFFLPLLFLNFYFSKDASLGIKLYLYTAWVVTLFSAFTILRYIFWGVVGIV